MSLIEFVRAFGSSPIAFLNHYRLSRAGEYLIKTDLGIKEIAEKVGINDATYFSKMFKSAYQMSVREYRKFYKKI